MSDLDRRIGQLTILRDRLRRSMYLFARKHPSGVRRDEVAGELGISRRLAAFHLDKLAEEGLLDFHYARPPGRSGPGAGRPAKVYRPVDPEVEVSLPERRYDIMGQVLAESVAGSDEQMRHAMNVAYQAGLKIGHRIKREERLRPPGAERATSVMSEVLEGYGFEPSRSDDELSLLNCPFHAMAQHHPELVCGMNQRFLEGILQGLGTQSLDAVLQPTSGQCCVRLRPRSPSESGTK